MRSVYAVGEPQSTAFARYGRRPFNDTQRNGDHPARSFVAPPPIFAMPTRRGARMASMLRVSSRNLVLRISRRHFVAVTRAIEASREARKAARLAVLLSRAIRASIATDRELAKLRLPSPRAATVP